MQVEFLSRQLCQFLRLSVFLFETEAFALRLADADDDVANGLVVQKQIQHQRGFIIDQMKEQHLFRRHWITGHVRPVYHFAHHTPQQAAAAWAYFNHVGADVTGAYDRVLDRLNRVVQDEWHSGGFEHCNSSEVWIYEYLGSADHVPSKVNCSFSTCGWRDRTLAAALFCYRQLCTMDAWESLQDRIQNMQI